MAMVDYPYPSSFLTPMPGYPVNFSCQAFTGMTSDDSDESFFQALYNSAMIFYDYENNTECNELFVESDDGQNRNI
jgi:lysosomal Pro-X carboxypeptidase